MFLTITKLDGFKTSINKLMIKSFKEKLGADGMIYTSIKTSESNFEAKERKIKKASERAFFTL